MEHIFPAAIFLLLISCTTSHKLEDSLTAKGCNIDSVRKQSELTFNRLDKKRKTPPGMFKTVVYENDTCVMVERSHADGDIRNGGGMNFIISKRTCKVVSGYVFQ